MKNNFFVFFIICCFSLLTASCFLSVPAGALVTDKVTITGIIPLVTYDISVTGIDWTIATVSWSTNGNANSAVEYGTTTAYGSLVAKVGMSKDHLISLSGLLPGTTYHFRVISNDILGTSAVSSDQTFTTTGPTPTPVPTQSSGGENGGSDSGGSGTGDAGAVDNLLSGLGNIQPGPFGLPVPAFLAPPDEQGQTNPSGGPQNPNAPATTQHPPPGWYLTPLIAGLLLSIFLLLGVAAFALRPEWLEWIRRYALKKMQGPKKP